jgi:alpha-L-fucosidase 2
MIHRDSLSVYNFKWVQEQVRLKDYKPVQARYDTPYDVSIFPSKIPGGGLEFSLSGLGKADSVRLLLNHALCEVQWAGGVRLQTLPLE